VRVRVALEHFNPETELAAFLRDQHAAGAVASFVGLCRSESHGEKITALTLDHFEGFTDKEIVRLSGEAAKRFALDDLLVIHRAGRILPGEAIVLVAASSAHRRAAFDAVDFLMDYLKTEAPFWKQEETQNGARWVEPRTDDHTDKKRWEKE